MSWFSRRFPKSAGWGAPDDGAADAAMQEIVMPDAGRLTLGTAERELVIAYLSYAMDDVAALSPAGLQLLCMTIAALKGETAALLPAE
ncbi:MAG TPA: hypothetical protein VEK75_18005 [Xanthobacteraceae bacterium]|nr:hypothetical protein [Xanthobacteraceae bacterium]